MSCKTRIEIKKELASVLPSRNKKDLISSTAKERNNGTVLNRKQAVLSLVEMLVFNFVIAGSFVIILDLKTLITSQMQNKSPSTHSLMT